MATHREPGGSHYPGGTTDPAEIVAAAAAADSVVTAARSVRGVAEVGKPEPSADSRWVRVQAVLADPPDSAAALDTVDRLRAAVRTVPAWQALVGGETARLLDEERAVERDNRVVMPLILAVVFLILVLLLRALVAPLVGIGILIDTVLVRTLLIPTLSLQARPSPYRLASRARLALAGEAAGPPPLSDSQA